MQSQRIIGSIQALGKKGKRFVSEFLTGRSRLLWNTISCNDYHEDYYHAFLAGIFEGRGYHVESNKEKGLGKPDILLRDKRNRQMIREQYAEGLYGYTQIFCYGISFFRSRQR